MTVAVFIPDDMAARALGAGAVAVAIANEAEKRGLDVAIVRTGSRGLMTAEPLVEVDTADGRVGYAGVREADVAGLFDAGFLGGAGHPASLGRIDDHPFFAGQMRVISRRFGIADPLDLDAYTGSGGYAGLEAALGMEPAAVVEAVLASGLRGRGGAAFPAGIKWKTVAGANGQQKYIVCNADEGDSGTFADRLVMESDPYLLIEGMTIAGLAVGASRGIVYLRSEYPVSIERMRAAISRAQSAGYLGADIRGTGRRFELEVFVGAGAYICGEETALLDSLEGKRGQVRAKPPLPALEGLFGQPTLVHNVVSLASVPDILSRGADWYAGLGVGRSTGTMPFQIAGNVRNGGLVELPFGVPIRTLVETYGGGTRSGRPVRAVQIGGPLGAYLPDHLLDTPTDYEALKALGAGVGHGGLVVFDDTVDLMEQAHYAFAFCAHESCGKCTPCRVGAVRGAEVIDRWRAGDDAATQETLVRDLCEVMVDGSLCAMGGMTPIPVLSALDHFPEDFRGRGSALDEAAE